jgi:hypothetical protein
VVTTSSQRASGGTQDIGGSNTSEPPEITRNDDRKESPPSERIQQGRPTDAGVPMSAVRDSTVGGLMGATGEPHNVDDYVLLNQWWDGDVVRISSTKRGRRFTWLTLTIPYESRVSRRLERWFVADVERTLTTTLESPDGRHRIAIDVSLTNDPTNRELLLLPCVASDANCRLPNGSPAAGSAVRGGSTLWLSPEIMRNPGGGAHELLHNIGLGHQPTSTCSIMSYCEGGKLLYQDALRIIDRYDRRY